ncbi:hypothetical protein DFH09DRAFT_1354087 [Mycena vulgaris]|nr:hypothetical protein DFH09DRAFT_1354087 [Mycena vulgaris]
MLITFSPALGETLHVSANGTRKSTVQLHFAATILFPADYEHIASGRVKLQVWSDIPASGRSSGDWGEAEFRPVQFNSPHDQGFSLVPDKKRDEIRTTLTVTFSVPLSAQHFSFTYRLVYPTGDIKWLGQYGQNGTLVLDRTDSEPVLLGEGWVPTDNGAYRRDSGGSPVQGLEVARLSHPADHTAYAMVESSFLYPQDSALVVLLPCLSSHQVILPPTLIFAAPPSASISFTSHGAITMSGTGSLLFIACESAKEAESAVSRVINHCSSSQFRAVSYAHGAVVLASALDTHPVEVAIIPMASSTLLTQSRLTLQSLASLIPASSQFCLFSPAHFDARFFSREIAETSDESVSFSVGQSGGQFVVAPTERVNLGERGWQVGITSSFTPASLPVPAEGLPTPPPSPRLRPLTHRISETISQSPDPSFLSLPAAISSDDRPASRSSSHLVLHSEATRRAGVLAAIRHIFFVFLTWFSRVFWGPPPPAVQPQRIVDERTPLLQEPGHAHTPELSAPAQENVQQPPPAGEPPLPSSYMSADVEAGKTTILFQATHLTPVFDVPIQLNGVDVDFNVQRTEDRVFLVDFSSPTGGRLKIGW